MTCPDRAGVLTTTQLLVSEVGVLHDAVPRTGGPGGRVLSVTFSIAGWLSEGRCRLRGVPHSSSSGSPLSVASNPQLSKSVLLREVRRKLAAGASRRRPSFGRGRRGPRSLCRAEASRLGARPAAGAEQLSGDKTVSRLEQGRERGRSWPFWPEHQHSQAEEDSGGLGWRLESPGGYAGSEGLGEAADATRGGRAPPAGSCRESGGDGDGGRPGRPGGAAGARGPAPLGGREVRANSARSRGAGRRLATP